MICSHCEVVWDKEEKGERGKRKEKGERGKRKGKG